MVAELNMSFDEVLAEIERLSEESPEGWTVDEMSKALGHSRNWCRRKLSELIAHGKAEFAGTAGRTRIDGHRCRTPVYRLVK